MATDVHDPHKQEAATILQGADELIPRHIANQSGELAAVRQSYITEALVHAVLHLADVLDVRNTLEQER